MIRLKIDFVKSKEIENFIKVIEVKYDIVEKSKIKPSKKEGSLFKVQYLDLMEKEIIHE